MPNFSFFSCIKKKSIDLKIEKICLVFKIIFKKISTYGITFPDGESINILK